MYNKPTFLCLSILSYSDCSFSSLVRVLRKEKKLTDDFTHQMRASWWEEELTYNKYTFTLFSLPALLLILVSFSSPWNLSVGKQKRAILHKYCLILK